MRIHLTRQPIALSLWLLTVLFSQVARAQTAPLAAAPAGPAVSFEKRCYSCHNIGSGNKKGPDLNGVTDRRTRDWLHEYIETPAAFYRKGDPTAVELFTKFAPEVMPDQALTTEEIDAILNMIQALTRKGEVYVPPGAKLARVMGLTDVYAGWRLFTGRDKLQNGGAACISCHTLASAGRLGGGTLGPDLTTANIKYRNPELISILQNPNFPTMSSVFAAHPLSDEEIVKLFALFDHHRRQNPTAQAGATTYDFKFPLLGAITLIGAVVGMNWIWKNRHRGVREEIVRRSRI